MSDEDPPSEPIGEQRREVDERVRTSVPTVSVRQARRRRPASDGAGFLYLVFGTVGVAGLLALFSLGRIIARAL